jgi:hypothetical protein
LAEAAPLDFVFEVAFVFPVAPEPCFPLPAEAGFGGASTLDGADEGCEGGAGADGTGCAVGSETGTGAGSTSAGFPVCPEDSTSWREPATPASAAARDSSRRLPDAVRRGRGVLAGANERKPRPVLPGRVKAIAS